MLKVLTAVVKNGQGPDDGKENPKMLQNIFLL
jgi:hypothetical protein